jgi:hypothetical protein
MAMIAVVDQSAVFNTGRDTAVEVSSVITPSTATNRTDLAGTKKLFLGIRPHSQIATRGNPKISILFPHALL